MYLQEQKQKYCQVSWGLDLELRNLCNILHLQGPVGQRVFILSSLIQPLSLSLWTPVMVSPNGSPGSLTAPNQLAVWCGLVLKSYVKVLCEVLCESLEGGSDFITTARREWRSSHGPQNSCRDPGWGSFAKFIKKRTWTEVGWVLLQPSSRLDPIYLR